MRTISGANVTYNTAAAATGAGQRTDFLQSSSMADILVQFAAIATLLATQQGQDWELAFINLAGGGSGAEFVLELRWANNAAAGLVCVGVADSRVQGTASLASQAEANRLSFDAALAAYQTLNAANGIEFNQTLLAGASQGTRVGDLLLVANTGPL